MHLHVRTDGTVYVSASHRISDEDILRFIRKNVSWIEKQKKIYEDRPGRDYYETKKNEFDRKVAALLPKWEEKTGLRCRSWHSRYMTSRWGSCIPSKGRICFNLQLSDKPERYLEYVILHELMHLKHPGHGKDFKDDLSRYMPEWKEIDKKLG